MLLFQRRTTPSSCLLPPLSPWLSRAAARCGPSSGASPPRRCARSARATAGPSRPSTATPRSSDRASPAGRHACCGPCPRSARVLVCPVGRLRAGTRQLAKQPPAEPQHAFPVHPSRFDRTLPTVCQCRLRARQRALCPSAVRPAPPRGGTPLHSCNKRRETAPSRAASQFQPV